MTGVQTCALPICAFDDDLIYSLQNENKKLKGEIEQQQVDNAELASRLSVQCDNVKQALDTRDELRQQRDALKSHAEKAEATVELYESTSLATVMKARDEAEAKLAALKKRLWELRGFGLAKMLLGDFFPETAPKLKKAKEPELCGVCGGVRGCCLCLEGTQKHFSGIAERAKKVKAK